MKEVTEIRKTSGSGGLCGSMSIYSDSSATRVMWPFTPAASVPPCSSSSSIPAAHLSAGPTRAGRACEHVCVSVCVGGPVAISLQTWYSGGPDRALLAGEANSFH